MASYYEIEVRPNASGWSAKLEAQIGAPMRALAEEFKRRFKEAGQEAFDGIGARLRANLDPAARSAADNLRDQLRRGIRDGMNGTPGNSNRQGNQQGRQFADAFSRQVKAKLEASFRSLPDVPLGLNSSAADVEIAGIRAKLVAATKDLELGVDTGVVDARVEALQARLKALSANATDVRVRVNTTAALAEIDAFRAALKGDGAKAADDFTDVFTRKTREKLRAAFESLPKLEIDANSSDVDKKIAEIRTKLEAADNDIKIGADSKQVDVRLAELRAELRSLATGSTDIRVRANTGTALAELEALRRSTKRFEDDDKEGNFFTRRLRALNLLGPAANSATSELGALGGAASSSSNNVYVLVGVVAALIAALSTVGPLVAGAFGGIVGLAGVAGVAGLALLGIKKQMAEQVGYGESISHLFKNITGQISGLAQVAANAVGPALTDVLGLVREVLPSFEGLVNLVAGHLGGAFREVGIALVSAFQKAQPLIVQVSDYIEQGAAGLSRWVASDSFNDFIDYARQNLPLIVDLVKNTGAAIINLFVALAPLGEVVLTSINYIIEGLSKVAKFLPALNIFGTITSLVLGGKSKKSSSDSAIDDLLKSYQSLGSAAAGAAAQAGPLDNYKKIIGDLAPALQLAAGNSGQFSVAVAGIDARMRAATPALREFIDTASSYDPGSAKVADTAKLLGDAFTAARGNALDYTATVLSADTATQSIAKTIHENIKSVADDGTLLGVSHLDAAGKFVDASNKYSEGSSAIVQGFQAQVKAATDAATATYTNELATKGQAVAAQDALTIYKGYRQSFIDSTVAAGTARDAAQALADQYFAIPPDVDTFVKLLGQNDVSLAIQGLTAALNRLSDFIGAPKVTLDPSPVNNALAGMSQGLDYFGHKTATPTVNINDQVSDHLQRVQSNIDRLHGKTVEINVVTNGSADGYLHGSTPSAYGNIFSSVGHYAAGGIVEGLTAKLQASARRFARGSENHVPQIALPGGATRIWAEPETQGEAYIPFALDRRMRAENILGDVARRFDGAFLPSRVVTALSAGSSSGGGSVAFPGTVTLVDADGSILAHARVVADQRIGAAAAANRVGSIGPDSRGY